MMMVQNKTIFETRVPYEARIIEEYNIQRVIYWNSGRKNKLDKTEVQ